LEGLTAAGLKAEGDFESGTMAAKIRNAQLQKIPYMLVIGKKEEESSSVAVRKRSGEQSFGVKLETFIDEVNQKTAAFQ
jgi:threonyl-tRNA synthetase